MEAPQGATISHKLNCSLEDLIGSEKRRPAQAGSGRRIVKTEESTSGRPRLRPNRSLDIAVTGIVRKGELPQSVGARSRGAVSKVHRPYFPPGYAAAPGPYAIAPPRPAAARLTPQETALLSTEITQRENGDVVVTLKQTEVVVVKADSGDLILNSGGFRTFSTRAVINQALQPVNLKLDETHDNTQTSDRPPSSTTEWVVSDGRMYLQCYSDGMVIRQAGAFNKHQILARGSVILQHMRQKKADVETKYSKNPAHRNRARIRRGTTTRVDDNASMQD